VSLPMFDQVLEKKVKWGHSPARARISRGYFFWSLF